MKKYLRFSIKDKMMTGFLEDGKVQATTGEVYDLDDVHLLPPCTPSKILCAGLNYHKHAEEVGGEIPELPLLFLKPPTSLIGPGDGILYPSMVNELHYEAELAVVIGERCHKIKKEEVKEKILGYTCFNDVTARDLQRRDGQWTRSKSFDTFAPTGPFIVSSLDPQDLHLSLYLNGELCQSSSTEDMIFSVEEIISFASHIMTLLPGDIIATGTPSGIGPMEVGDVVEVKIPEIGVLKNTILMETKEGKNL